MIACVLLGHNFSNEVQVVAQVFFPNSRFGFYEEVPTTGLAVVGILAGSTATGKLYKNGQCMATSTVKEAPKQNIKRTMMLAIFYALKEGTSRQTPWGALTGVRPAKQVRLWLAEGDSEAEITERLSSIYKLRDDKIKLAIAVARAEENTIEDLAFADKKGLYIGIPFCQSRCLYCSFVTAQKAKKDAHERYLAALAKECKKINPAGINTVYIGGGTPTALSERELETLLEIATPFVGGVEYTVEAGRPDSLTREKLYLLKDYGVTRIAINPQTLNDGTLERIGRSHTARDFYKAYEMAQQIGFTNINTDVIAGLPGEGPEDMLCTMQGLQKLAPPHITVHTLAVKRASRLNEHLESYDAAESETVDAMLNIAREICEDIGLAPYYMYRQKNMVGHFENVGYSLKGSECIYNVAMMAETQTVIAVGAGAVSKIIEGDLIRREFNPKDVEIYIERMS